MIVTVTFALAAESRNEAIGGEYAEFRAQVEAIVLSGAFGPSDKVRLRWLLKSGSWTPVEETK